MRIRDLIASAFGGLWRQKARTALTLLGVSVGTTALAFSLALGVGLRAFIENEFKSRGEFWSINVHPQNFGYKPFTEADVPPEKLAFPAAMPEERKARLKQRIVQDYQQHQGRKRTDSITPERLRELEAIPDVLAVRTRRVGMGKFSLEDKLEFGSIYGGDLGEIDPPLGGELLIGRVPISDSESECLISEFALFRMGFTTDEAMAGCLGREVLFEMGTGGGGGGSLAFLLNPNAKADAAIAKSQLDTLDKIAKQLPEQIDKFDLTPIEKAAVKATMTHPKADEKGKGTLKNWEAKKSFRIVGVLRTPPDRKPNPADLYSKPAIPAMDLLVGVQAERELFRQNPEFADLGYSDVTVLVRPGGDLEATVTEIENRGLGTYNSLKFYRSVKREVTLISAGLNLFALLSLLVASIGIANTLFTSVLERTREIGILKSLGARDGHILWLFLLEGAAIGLLGSLLGWGFAYLLSLPADRWVKQLIENQRAEKLISETVFDWPGWLPTAVVTFSVILTTLAAIYPAFRAARVRPVEALRHE